MYDWANSAFATTVMAGFFPVFFKSYWASGMSATESTVRLGTTNAVASLLVVLLAPVLGVVADRSGSKGCHDHQKIDVEDPLTPERDQGPNRRRHTTGQIDQHEADRSP